MCACVRARVGAVGNSGVCARAWVCIRAERVCNDIEIKHTVASCMCVGMRLGIRAERACNDIGIKCTMERSFGVLM